MLLFILFEPFIQKEPIGHNLLGGEHNHVTVVGLTGSLKRV